MPLPTIYTDQLVLRPCTENDVDALHRLWTHAEICRYLFDGISISCNEAVALVRSSMESAENTGLGLWGIVSELNAPLLGFCGFRYCNELRGFELLYGLQPRCWGQGLATEACLGILSYFWNTTQHDRVFARADLPNSRSAAVLQRLGMKQLGMQHGPPGQPLNTFAIERPSRK